MNNRQHTAYILQPPTSSSTSTNSSRNRVRDRKNQSSLRHGQKSSTSINVTSDEQSQQSSSAAAMRSLDRKQARPLPHNSTMNSTTSKSQMKTSHTDIYGSLERNKHSKVSQPILHGTILNNENDRLNKTDSQAHDFYHLTPTLPSQSNTTSTIVNVGNALQQQQQHASFDYIDSNPPPLPPTSSTTRSRRPPPPPSVFQPHFDSSTATPKDSYYTISGSKDVSPHPHPHTHIRGLVADNFYSGPYANKPPVPPPSQQQQSMQRYDTSPLLVRRLENLHPTQTRYQPQTYNRTQSSTIMTTSQPPSGRLNVTNPNQSSSALLFRPHSSQSSSSQSSGYETTI